MVFLQNFKNFTTKTSSKVSICFFLPPFSWILAKTQHNIWIIQEMKWYNSYIPIINIHLKKRSKKVPLILWNMKKGSFSSFSTEAKKQPNKMSFINNNSYYFLWLLRQIIKYIIALMLHKKIWNINIQIIKNFITWKMFAFLL